MNLSLLDGLTCVEPIERGPCTTITLVGRVSKPDIDGLCERARELLDTGSGALVCDVGGLTDPDVVSVDAIARIQLIASKAGRKLELRNARTGLCELLDLAGLTDVIETSTD